ncbi:MAG: putative Fe-S protein YdhL (DUF1289 family) [Motiliproteus sp.]
MPTITSPCIRNCCLDDQDICVGCVRTLDEILQWGAADDRRKSQILEAILERKKARLTCLEERSTASLTAKQKGFDAGKNDLGSHRGQDQAGDLAEDI